jgi:hypothetical protein
MGCDSVRLGLIANAASRMPAEISYIYRATTVIVNEPTPTIDMETDPSGTDKSPAGAAQNRQKRTWVCRTSDD